MDQSNHIKIQINHCRDISDYSTITPFNSPSSTSSITNNTNDETENTCSICLEDINNNNDSIIACSCKNPVHINCLLTWIEYKNTINCEICNTQYSIPNHIIQNFYQENFQNINSQVINDQHDYPNINDEDEDNYPNINDEDYNYNHRQIRNREQRLLEIRRQIYENRMNRLYSAILYSIILLFILLIILYTT